MGPCYTCKKTVAFGGVKDHGFRFCSNACHAEKAVLLDVLKLIPASAIDAEAQSLQKGACVKCGSTGGVEVHKSILVWSAIVFTRSSEKTFVGCRGCALEKQAYSAAGTLLFGWWGIPFGVIFTPIALLANGYYMVRSSMRGPPSSLLKEHARERLALAHSYGAPVSDAVRVRGRIEPRF